MKKLSIEQAWEVLFEKHNIISKVVKNGRFKITSAEINEIKEARLMAKFDSSAKLPRVFKENELSILPTTRGEYVIGHFKTHQSLDYSDVKPISIRLPSLQTLNYTDLYNEASSLLFAYNSGIISDIFQNYPVNFTISGRMSSGAFDFEIDSSIYPKDKERISVINAQMEIDAGYEARDAICLCEAKNIAAEEVLIRQLYYPYRLWKTKVTKDIIPLFFVYSNDMFHAFIYKFDDPNHYNSLKLVQRKTYIFIDEKVTFDDVLETWRAARGGKEPKVAFPQADSFERILDLLSVLYEKPLMKDEITLKYEFDSRQTDYYITACEYLGFVEKGYNDEGERIYSLSERGKAMMGMQHRAKYIEIIRSILKNPVFYQVFGAYILSCKMPTKEEICSIMAKSSLHISDSTIERRASTVRSWIDWIIRNIEFQDKFDSYNLI